MSRATRLVAITTSESHPACSGFAHSESCHARAKLARCIFGCGLAASDYTVTNRYCHFCQHVKVRASSMLACENQECSRRFCEHCLLTHLGEDVDPMSSDAWSMVNGKVIVMS